MSVRRVLVFGVFDGIHDGHRSFLRQAKACGDYLVVAVARDAVVEKLKARKPIHREEERRLALEKEGVADEVVLGDRELGSWEVVERIQPNVVVFGYDQVALGDALERAKKENGWMFELRIAEVHERGT